MQDNEFFCYKNITDSLPAHGGSIERPKCIKNSRVRLVFSINRNSRIDFVSETFLLFYNVINILGSFSFPLLSMR